MNSKKLIWSVAIIALIVILFFAFSGKDSKQNLNAQEELSDSIPTEDSNIKEKPSDNNPTTENPVWLSTELTDSITGETFTIGGFDKPVLFESFAVWCPKCKSQQQELKEFHEETGFTEDDVISISLDTDPNEDVSQVKKHAESNEFSWRFAVSPIELTQSLIEEFGPGIVSAPNIPMVIVCPDKTFKKLDSGHKNNAELKEAVAFCN
ncbi:MAG: TlpA family protein disulfide reductase [Nanoarchaeota archaeon]|nr:TlpA family protein disulfide reductase [Nanoarchaeota archaeon]